MDLSWLWFHNYQYGIKNQEKSRKIKKNQEKSIVSIFCSFRKTKKTKLIFKRILTSKLPYIINKNRDLFVVVDSLAEKAIYRVSHGKVNKVIWLCWGYSFWFLLIFWVLCVHVKGTFMLNSSVFIFLMFNYSKPFVP